MFTSMQYSNRREFPLILLTRCAWCTFYCLNPRLPIPLVFTVKPLPPAAPLRFADFPGGTVHPDRNSPGHRARAWARAWAGASSATAAAAAAAAVPAAAAAVPVAAPAAILWAPAVWLRGHGDPPGPANGWGGAGRVPARVAEAENLHECAFQACSR